jgi:hypothetical protein
MNPYLILDDVDLDGLKVLVRSDLNVPLDNGRVGDDFRIRSALPTLEQLVDAGADVTVCSHLGRPEGADPAFSMAPVANRMRELSRHGVGFERGGEITVLENTRFLAGETSNDRGTAERLADGFELFVQDAFGSVHRAHASTVGVAELVRSAAGPLLDAELTALGRFLADPDRPYTVVLGGAKVSDKLGVIETLLPKVDRNAHRRRYVLHLSRRPRLRGRRFHAPGGHGGQGGRHPRRPQRPQDHSPHRHRRGRGVLRGHHPDRGRRLRDPRRHHWSRHRPRHLPPGSGS